MPSAPAHECNHPGCHVLVRGTPRCPKHPRAPWPSPEAKRRIEERRGTSAERGYGARWQAARKAFLDANPLCAECDRRGRTVRATVVDHIIPHRGDEGLFWDQSNWQALCRRCHSRKTAKEDGRWG